MQVHLITFTGFSLHPVPLAGASGAGGGAAGVGRRCRPIPRPPRVALAHQLVEIGHWAGDCGERTAGECVVCWARIDCLWQERRPGQLHWLLPSPERRNLSSVASAAGEKLPTLTLAASITSNSTSSPSPTLRRNFLGLFLLMAVYWEAMKK